MHVGVYVIPAKAGISTIAFFWIPAGVYPVLDTGREWQIEEDICYAAINNYLALIFDIASY